MIRCTIDYEPRAITHARRYGAAAMLGTILLAAISTTPAKKDEAAAVTCRAPSSRSAPATCR